MSNNITRFFFLVMISCFAFTAQAQTPCAQEYIDVIRENLEDALSGDQPDVETALQEITALRACDTSPDSRDYIDEQYNRIIQVSKKVAIEADSLRIIAEKETQKAANALSLAKQEKENAEKANTAAELAKLEAQEGERQALINYYMGVARVLATEAEPSVNNYYQKAIQITAFVHNHLDADHPQVKQMIMHLFHLSKRRNIEDELEPPQYTQGDNVYYYDDDYEDEDFLYEIYEEDVSTLSKVAVAPHSSVIAITSYYSNFIQIWDTKTNNTQQLHFNTRGLNVGDMAWSLDGNYLAAVASNTLFIWSSYNWVLQEIIPLNNAAYGLTLDWSVANDLAIGTDNGTVSIFSGEHFEHKNTFELHSDYVRSVSWSPDGKQLLTTSDDYTIYLLDIDAGMIIYEKTDFSDYVRAGDWHPQTNQILVGDDTGELTSIDYDNDATKSIADGYGILFKLEFSKNGHFYAFIDDLNSLMVHDAKNHQVIQSFSLDEVPVDFAWSADDSLLWVVIENSTQLTTYSAHSGERTDYEVPEISQIPINSFLKNDAQNGITAVAWDPSNENRLAAGDVNGHIRIFLDDSSESVDTIMAFNERIDAIAWGNKSLLAVVDEKRVSIWNVNTKTMVHVIPFWNSANAVGWSTSGAFLAVGDGAGNLTIWRTSTWELIEQRKLPFSSIMTLDWANLNNKLLAVGTTSGQGLVIDLDRPKPIFFTESHNDWIRDIEWLPGDSLIVSSGDDQQTILWEWKYGLDQIPKKATIHDSLGYHLSVAVTDDNSLLHIGVGTGQISVWDISDTIPQKVGYVAQPNMYFIDIAAIPAHNRIATSAPGGGPLFYNTYEFQPAYKAWNFHHTKELETIEDTIGHNDFSNVYLYSSLPQLLWLNNQQKHAVISKDSSQVMIYDQVGDPAPSVLPLPQKAGEKNILAIYKNETNTHLVATIDTSTTYAYIWSIGDPIEEATVLSAENNSPLKQMTVNNSGTLVGGIDANDKLFIWELDNTGNIKNTYQSTELSIRCEALQFIKFQNNIWLEVTQDIDRRLYAFKNEAITEDTSATKIFRKSNTIIRLNNTNRAKEYMLIGYTGNQRKLNLERQTIENIKEENGIDFTINSNIIFAHEENFLAIFDTDLGKFVTDNRNSFLSVWELSSSTVKPVQEFKGTRGHRPLALMFSEGKKHLILSSTTDENEFFLWIWERDNDGIYQLLSKESHQANHLDVSPDRSFVLTQVSFLGRIDFWSVNKNENFQALKNQTTESTLTSEDILDFKLEDVFAHNVQNSIKTLQQNNHQQQVANWAEYLLEEGNATTIKTNKERYYQHALTLLQQHPEFTYDQRSPLHYLYARANILYGKFLQRESRSRDSIYSYYRTAIGLGGMSDPAIIANVALADWKNGNKQLALESIFDAQNSPIILELKDSIQSIFENQKEISRSNDMHDFLRIVYLDNIPATLRKEYDLPGFQLNSQRSIVSILTPINAQGTNNYLLHYYQQNSQKFIFDRDERIYFAEQGVALIESTTDKSEDHFRRLLTLQHVLVSAYKEKNDLILAYKTLSSSLETARSVYRQINIDQPGFAPIFKQETLMPLFSELAYLELLQNKNARTAEDLLNRANNDFNIDDSPSMLMQRGHIELFNNNFDAAIQYYLMTTSENLDYRSQIYQEIIALGLKSHLKAVGEILRPG